MEANRDAYRLIKGIRALYIDRLGEQAIDRRALKRRYDGVRLMILRSILRTTPQEYRENDARFLIGAIEWKAGDRDAAIRTWQGLQIRNVRVCAESMRPTSHLVVRRQLAKRRCSQSYRFPSSASPLGLVPR